MNLRTLLLSFALAATACTVAVPNQFPCTHPGSTTECGANQICGNDQLCTNIVACGKGQARCNGNCVDITTDPNNCGDCGISCDRTKGEVCQPPASEGGKAACAAFCFKGQTDCGGTCRDTSTDNNNCGACGVVCPAGFACTASGPGGAGQCTLVCQTQPTLLTACNNTCVDTQRDIRNCGTCGTVCPSGEVCANGTCAVSCPSTERACGSPAQCVNTSTDRNNCGACGNVCAAGHICQGGNCQTLSCPDPLVDCGTGTCVNPNNDTANCGYCAGQTNPRNGVVGKVCATGSSCVAVAGTPTCSLVCPTGQSACASGTSTFCVDQQTDPKNCGACGTVCADGQSCQGGTCKATCKAGLTDCGGALGCVDTLNDPNHCGTGTTGCAAPACPAGDICKNGQCQPTCGSGLALCPASWAPSTAYAVGQQIFVAGNLYVVVTAGTSAATGSGPSGTSNGIADGTVVWNFVQSGAVQKCATTDNDPANCGTCGTVCGAGLTCSGGSCGVACGPGSVACNGSCVDIDTDNQNCGGCSAPGGGVPNFACQAGQICDGTGHCATTCGIGKAGPLTICSLKCVDTTSDAANCGACGKVCASGEVCSGGVCTVSCQAGLSACTQAGGSIACKDLTQDRNNCGSCGTTCGDGQVCAPNGSGGFACATSCPTPPLAGCGGVCTNVSVDPNNCGWCAGQTSAGGVTGKVCAAGAGQVAFCSSGNCQAACASGFADCDGNAANGCEVNTAADPLHCGDCKTRCPAPDNAAPTSCSGGVCQGGFACLPGFQDCDANAPGCETSLASDSKNCGGSACGSASCQGTSSLFCAAGACSPNPSGVEQNVLVADLTLAGWSQCSVDDYGSTTSIDTVKTSCRFGTATSWLVGCGTATTLKLAAAGAPSDVLFATSAGAPHVVAATGVEWYFDSGTFGFAPAGASLSRGVSACDSAGAASDGYLAGFGSQRLCWLTAPGGTSGNFVAGQRCGDAALNDTTYQRFVFYK